MIEVAEVAAEDVGVAATELLDVMRTLARMGYEELVVDAGGAHSHPIDTAAEDDDAEFVDPPTAKRLGFHG